MRATAGGEATADVTREKADMPNSANQPEKESPLLNAPEEGYEIDGLVYRLGNDESNNITGGDASKKYVLDGGTGADILKGNSGDDQLWGGPGDDMLDGGAGKDAANYTGDSEEYDFK